jgi:hypothetical protein
VQTEPSQTLCKALCFRSIRCDCCLRLCFCLILILIFCFFCVNVFLFLQAALLDTYTDSNTRERRPYEADGLVESTGRLWIQRDYMWARHSHSYVITCPTCIVVVYMSLTDHNLSITHSHAYVITNPTCIVFVSLTDYSLSKTRV